MTCHCGANADDCADLGYHCGPRAPKQDKERAVDDSIAWWHFINGQRVQERLEEDDDD